ncbi:MAG: sensor histidine kinase [Actinomycetes bacterium]
MTTRSTTLVGIVAASSVATSVVALIVTGRSGDPLPVQTVNLAVLAGAAAVMATLLHQRMPENNLWRALLVIAVVGPLAVVLFSVTRTQSNPSQAMVAALWLIDVPLAIPWMLFIGLFPDGHRPISWWPTLVWGGGTLLVAVSVVAWLSAPDATVFPVPGHLPGAGTGAAPGHPLNAFSAEAASALTGLLTLAAAACLLHRYGRSGPVMRQQIRVGAAGLVTCVILEIALRALSGVDDRPAQLVVAVVAVSVGALGVAAGLLRWRLWIVDQALPRAVVLGACSAAFTAAIVAGALLVTGRVGASQVQAAVLAAALVTVLVQSYSRRLEPWVRRLVYGEQPGGFAVLIGLADGLASLDDQAAATRIADAARRGLGVPWVGFWSATARQRVFRLLATVGEVAAPEVVQLSSEQQPASRGTRLLVPDEPRDPFPDDAAAVSLLSSDEGPWGLLVVGQRRGEPLTAGDVELLTVIARDAELARVNRRLLDEVAVSLEQLRSRAEQVKESRQRLVAAQDEERRRIERDLHDGAQHELIIVAGRLRQLASGPPLAPGALEDVAELAEQAVFSLQDLARGIYPSVLTDHGVAAAIRSYAGRLPVDVRLETEGEPARRRWPADLEVALYFVAVEALGNSRKHAGATEIAVALAERGGQVVLEVHDDGTGFEPTVPANGSGLQHMADRMAALGGQLVVDSRPGAGTWVTARAPLSVPQRPAVTVPSPTHAGTAARPAPAG